MTADELKRIAYREPFQPYQVTLKSGESFQVVRRFRTTVADPLVVFGHDEDPETGQARKMRLVYIENIRDVEPV